MPKVSTDANLYTPHEKGKYIYKIKRSHEKYAAQYHYKGLIKCGCFYSAQEARDWIDSEMLRWTSAGH